MKKIHLDEEFEKFWTKIENHENFAFMRNADGERAIMTGQAVSAQEGNWSSPNYVSKLGEDIYKSLFINEPNVYYAISCPCCDSEAYYWYSSRIPSKNRTFANLWINANYNKFIENFDNLEREAVLIANFRAEGHQFGKLNILKHYKINDDCIGFWETEAPQMINQIKQDFGSRNDILYVVSAGPMSGPIIAELYKNNPNNCYIDFGSSIDKYYRQGVTRPYMNKNNVFAKCNCWMDNPLTTDFDVSVVLNLYKRPDSLKIQIEALKNQSLKPKEIILFQDKAENTDINIADDIKNEFSNIKISETNVGVWGRFHFAQESAVSKYVCLFDDDTIPGRRWLENCHTEMLKQEGLYGTIGIVDSNIKNYPKSKFFRAGWDGNLDKTVEVDFVGHSWFFKREWLKYLFMAPPEVQNMKLAGEDMSFSYMLQKHAQIKTFVPPHPTGYTEFFGSIPEYAVEMGRSESAISMNSDNYNLMQKAVRILLDDGWNTLQNRNPKYVKSLRRQLKIARYKNSKKLTFLESIFSIKKEDDIFSKHDVVHILGIKIKIRKK